MFLPHCLFWFTFAGEGKAMTLFDGGVGGGGGGCIKILKHVAAGVDDSGLCCCCVCEHSLTPLFVDFKWIFFFQ